MSLPRPNPTFPFVSILGALCAVVLVTPANAAGNLGVAPTPVFAAASAPASGAPRLVRVRLSHALPIARLAREGFDIVDAAPGRSATLLEWPGDDARLVALGATVEVLDPDPGRTAAARTNAEFAARPAPPARQVRSATGPDGTFRTQSLPSLGSGSMGGFWTLAEVKMKLDDLVASDVHGVVADKLDTLGTTWAGRPIWGLRLGKASGPVVFFNALTHAREPEGMQALFYFVDDLLSGYGSDPFATYLLDHRKIYICPVVNPDGYALNESLYVANADTSFGFWRKNLRDNDGSGQFEFANDGVDLNRNYGFKWGNDDGGSSPYIWHETYRGPAPFSEPETQAQRDIVAALAPTTAITFHTWRDLMLHAWSYTGVRPPGVDRLYEWSDLLTARDAYQSGQSVDVLYLVNGDFVDWCYGDTLTKPRTVAWTTEIGDVEDSFYPPPSRIVPLAAQNLDMCYIVTALAGAYVQSDGFAIDEGALDAGHLAHLRVRARNHGAAATGAGLTGTLVALDPGVTVQVASVPYPALASNEDADPLAPFELVTDDTVTVGRLARFEVRFTSPAGFFSRDTVRVPLGTPTVIVMDDADSGLSQWDPGDWGIGGGAPDHPGPWFSDSPAGKYATNANNAIELATPLDLSAGVHAYASYGARWVIEKDYDATMIEASLDGVTWTPVSASGTTPSRGLGVQIQGAPSYSATRRGWRGELADLSPFSGPAGNAVRLRFRLVSDIGVEFDGFSFDSLRIAVYDPAAQPPLAVNAALPTDRTTLGFPVPNPARQGVHFEILLGNPVRVRLEIMDLQGRRVRMLADRLFTAGRHLIAWDGRDEAGLRTPAGVYFARLTDGVDADITRRFAVVR